ncbi:MAG TPA: hypothetical protein PK156_19275 [Polyangium sp.]|nr:hypothetical protein [Polyangium sp.]
MAVSRKLPTRRDEGCQKDDMKRFKILARERFQGDGMAVNRKDFTLFEEGKESDARLLTDPSLSLYCLDLSRREAVFVSLPPNSDLEAAPFYYEAQFAHALNAFTIDFDTFLSLSAPIPQPNKLILVHNIGRCGSTLLSRAFAQLDSCVSYSEPDCFTQIGHWRTVDDPRDSLWKSILTACMKFVFLDPIRLQPEVAIVKFRSGCVNLLDLFTELFPDAKHLFLYRDCSSWVASCLNIAERRGLEHTQLRDEALQFFRYFTGRAMEQSTFPYDRLGESLRPAERFTVCWLVSMEHVLRFHQAFPGLLFPVTYQELATSGEACLQRIFDYCELPRERLRDGVVSLTKDSQAGTKFAREDGTSGNKRQLTDEEIVQSRAILALHPSINDFRLILPDSP